jgi:curli production assembly/transport component CsgG
MRMCESFVQVRNVLRLSVVGIVALVLVGCASPPGLHRPVRDAPIAGPLTSTSRTLVNLPAPPRPLIVAVYDFSDQTGALKPNPNQGYADFSKAVTQGASSVLVDSLKFMGNGAWFTVVERSRLDALLRERKLIQDTYSAVKMTPEKRVSPLQFAEYLLEGGIISFDSTVVSGGIGASYLGIGPQASYLKNLITVTLRIVEVRTGNVIASVTTSKSIFSVSYNLSYTKYVSADSDLLDVRGAVTSSEPTQIAVREAIESAVYQLVQQAVPLRLWSSKPPEVIPPDVMARALRDAIKSQSHPGKRPDSHQGPAPQKPSPNVSLQGTVGLQGPLELKPAMRTAANAPADFLATQTVSETDLVFGIRPVALSGAFH